MSKVFPIGLGFAAIFLAGTLAIADEQPAPPASQPTSNEPTPQPAAAPENPNDPDKVICKREQMTGTRVATQKICMTRREWEQRESDEEADTRHSQRAQDLKNKDMPAN